MNIGNNEMKSILKWIFPFQCVFVFINLNGGFYQFLYFNRNIFGLFYFFISQVCEENRCQEEVFILALNYMDRFLALTPVPKTQLQILAAACLLLASKLREPSVRGLPADLLVFYTDNSISRRDLIVSKHHIHSLHSHFFYNLFLYVNLLYNLANKSRNQ